MGYSTTTVMKTYIKWLCLAVLAFLLVPIFTGCSKSASVDQPAKENAKLMAENELLRSNNVTLQAQAVKAAATTPTEEPPPKTEIDRAVNRALARRIAWEVTDTNLFTDYKITNHYREEAKGYTYFVYEFTAECDVASDGGSVSVDAYGREHRTYMQPEAARRLLARNPSATDQRVEVKRISLEGSMTFVKKGVKWYIEDRK